MVYLKVFLIVWFGVGFLYALWIWLFNYETFFSIFWNTLLGFPYILITFYQGLTYKRKFIYDLFEKKKAVIFDLDGTLIDTHYIWESAIDTVKADFDLSEVDIPPVKISGLSLNDKWIEILSLATKRPPVEVGDLVTRTKQEFLKKFSNEEPTDGFWSFARYLKEAGYKIALASNTDKDVVTEVIKRIGAENVFDTIVGGDEVKERKPHPEIYRKTIGALGVKPKEVVIFEDSIAGARAAVYSGADTIIVDRELFPRALLPKKIKFYITDFEGLEDLIKRDTIERLNRMAAGYPLENTGENQ